MSGPLFCRWNNQLARYRNSADYDFKNKKKIVDKAVISSQDPEYVPTGEENKIMAKVNDYFTPWSVFHHNWMEVYHIRKQDYLKLDYPDLIHKWPVLTKVKIVKHLVSITRILYKISKNIFQNFF